MRTIYQIATRCTRYTWQKYGIRYDRCERADGHTGNCHMVTS